LAAPLVASLLSASLLSGCMTDEPTEDCSPEGQKLFVASVMYTAYYWNDKLPPWSSLRLDQYDSPAAVLDALRYKLLDRYSNVQDAAALQSFYAGKLVGLGYRLTRLEDGTVQVLEVYAGSPAASGGMQRGMTLDLINGLSPAQIDELDAWGSVFGADEPGVLVDLEVTDRTGAAQHLTLEKAELQVTGVADSQLFDTDTGKVGYLLFDQFIGPSADALRSTFAAFQREGVTQLVVDLRYNGGGEMDVAQELASLLVGPAKTGSTFVTYDFNDNLSSWETTAPIDDYPEGLSLPKIAFIVGSGTASASEALVNGTVPLAEVGIIGERTYGKPVGFNGFRFCGQILQPVTFALANADGASDYYDGLAPTCEVSDDLAHELGDPAEARLTAALRWLADGTCPTPPATTAASALGVSANLGAPSPRPAPLREPPWRRGHPADSARAHDWF